MTGPFNYPTLPHMRRHGPRGYASYERYRPWLRDEFTFRCVFCLHREQWSPSAGTHEIDHFRPIAHNPNQAADYDNLLYCCATCNSAKRDRLLPLPTSVLLRDSVHVDTDGTIHPKTVEAAMLVEHLGLDSRNYTEFRSLWIGIVGMASKFDPNLFRRLMGFPEDLPDLGALRPPNGNVRPEGIETCHFNQRQRGELPAIY